MDISAQELDKHSLDELRAIRDAVDSALHRKALSELDKLDERANELRELAGLKKKVTSKVMRQRKKKT